MQAGTELAGRYVLVELLGRGGMGQVWRATDQVLDRPVAVKVISAEHADTELASRLKREARIAASLQHPGITVVHDVGSYDGQPFIVMELLHGHDLASILKDAPNGLPVDTVISLAIQAAEAVKAAHAARVIHRDLKPENLFLQDSGQLKICDFGIARAADATAGLTATGQAIGTVHYMSPEQCEGKRIDERSDLYSLGCVLYELLTGEPPFPEGQPLAIMFQHLNNQPPSARTVRSDTPVELGRLVGKLLAKNPAARPSDAGQVAAALKGLQQARTFTSDRPQNQVFQPPTNNPYTSAQSWAATQSWKTAMSVSEQLGAPDSRATDRGALADTADQITFRQQDERMPRQQQRKEQHPAQMRDHEEVDLGPAAGVSDRGLRHHRNEDAMVLAAEQAPDGLAVLAVVCDGVSSSARPDEASGVAAQAALPVLTAAVQAGGDLGEASLAAVAAARRAVAALQGPDGDTSATTFVSAVATGYEMNLCWLGDSRAYWLGQLASESRLLTLDDSVAGGMVAAGLVDQVAAMASPHARVLTRWLGGEAADLADDPERAAHVERYTPPGAGALLVCSDGLWSYAPEAADLAALALPKALTDPLGAAADMVKFAIDAGGADNITAVLIPYLSPLDT